MPLLIFVMTFLMVLGLMTYGRLESYTSFSAMRTHFEQFMVNKERQYYNARAAEWYADTVVNEKDKKEQKEHQKAKATSKLSLYPLLNKEVREQQEAKYVQHRRAFIALMEQLYRPYKFFQQAIEQNQEVAADLVQAMMDAQEALPQGNKVASLAELANLDLGDQLLNELFYRMLKGSSSKSITSQHSCSSPADVKEEGYPPLTQFITLDARSKLRLYLAPRLLLQILTEDKQLVEEIITTRKRLYQEVTADPPRLDAKTATSDFESFFSGRLSSLFDEEFLDFTVTKTNPADFE